MPTQRGMSSGTKLALTLVVGGIILSSLAAKYRLFAPMRLEPATGPVKRLSE